MYTMYSTEILREASLFKFHICLHGQKYNDFDIFGNDICQSHFYVRAYTEGNKIFKNYL